MTMYNVLAPPAQAGSAEPDPARFVFVKEGFCWPAFFIAPIWLLWRWMWLVFVLYVVVALGVLAAIDQVAIPVAWIVILLFNLLIGLEANNLRRWTLERRGYRFLGIASGDRMREAEFRFFASRAGGEPETTTVTAPEPKEARPERRRPVVGSSEVVGLFPKPGGLG